MPLLREPPMNPCKGTVFQIQRWSIHDGEGVRSTVFFKGCPLKCRWCANPESWNSAPEVFYFQERCTRCGRCAAGCQVAASSLNGNVSFDREKCTGCGACAAICPAGARKKIGTVMTIEEVMKVIKRDAVFYRESGGGVTFSGGEPFMQLSFLRELVLACSRIGIGMTVETCGYFNWERAKDIIALLDGVFVDIKHMDDRIHQKLTGVSNVPILENVIRIAELQLNTIVRVPLIEKVNASEKNIRAMCEFIIQHTKVKEVELLPYHNLGEPKHKAKGELYKAFTTPDAEKIAAMKEIITNYGIAIADYQ